ncbi:MAG: hypothetical protein NTZ78_12050 [Candidatus Aureabacteria bacterium]|nr:hypothetical protein [Candidatus Auribacterota bacterium]
MKKLITVGLSLMLLVGVSGLAVGGSLDSPGDPSGGSGMYTLQNLYEYLTSGAALTVQTSFQEPTSGPGSTMKTTKEIGDAIKALHDQCNVTADNVELGKTFFCTQSGSWGVRTGRAQVVPTPTPSVTPTPTLGQAGCEAKGGRWAPRNDLGGNYGCWLLGSTYDTSCDTTCGLVSLTCADGYWRDADCAACKLYKGGAAACSVGGCNPNNTAPEYSDCCDGCLNRCMTGFGSGDTGGPYTTDESRGHGSCGQAGQNFQHRLCVCR